MLFLLRFNKALLLLQFSFSCASANISFNEIIGDPLTTFDFSVSFHNSNLVCITFSVLFFVALFVEYSWIRKFLFLSEGAIIICQWGFGDDAACSF